MSKLWPTGGQSRARVDLASSPMYFQRLEFESESVIACKINICSRNLFGDGNGNPLQCSCLENPRDGGAWWAVVYGVAQSRTWLKRLSSSSSIKNLCVLFTCLYQLLTFALHPWYTFLEPFQPSCGHHEASPRHFYVPHLNTLCILCEDFLT